MSPTKYLLLSCLLLASLYVYSHARELTHLEDWVASNDGELDSSNDGELDSSNDEPLEIDTDDFVLTGEGSHRHKRKHRPCHRRGRSHPPKGAPTPKSLFAIDDTENERHLSEYVDSTDDELEVDDDDVALNGEEEHKKSHHKRKRHPCHRHGHGHPPAQAPKKENEKEKKEEKKEKEKEKEEEKKKEKKEKEKEKEKKKREKSHHKGPCHRHSPPPKGTPTYGPAQPPTPFSDGPAQSPQLFFDLDEVEDMELYEGLDSIDEESQEINEDFGSNLKKSHHKRKHHPCKRHAHAPTHPPKPSLEVESIDLD